MKKRALCVVLLTVMLLCTILFMGCHNFVDVTGYYAPYRILNADMPYSNNMHTSKFDKVEKLEEDSYGRCYYSYRTPSTMVDHYELEIHVICQKETKTDIYYYPDYCYMARGSRGNEEAGVSADAEFSEEAIKQLKELNDWNKPLNEGRLRQIPNKYQKSIVFYLDLADILRDYLNIDEETYVIVNDMEINDRNQQMFFCRVFEETEQDGSIAKDYVLVYQESDSQPIVAIEEIEHTLDCQDAMHNFRITWFEPEQ